jgi:hypothetical protein
MVSVGAIVHMGWMDEWMDEYWNMNDNIGTVTDFITRKGF